MGTVNDILEKIVPLAQKYMEEGLGLRVAIDKAIATLRETQKKESEINDMPKRKMSEMFQ